MYLGHLHLFSADLGIERLSAERYITGLPIDNQIPRLFADRLIEGQSTRQLVGDWLGSDRPPLQAGWVLLLQPWRHLLQIPPDIFAHAAGAQLQLWWIPAIAGVLQLMGAGRRLSAWLVVTLATYSMVLINSNYVWPKLAAASATLLGFSLLMLHDQPNRRQTLLAGVMLALAWLAHGSAAFAILAMVILAAAKPNLPKRSIALMLVTAAVIAGPWSAYQKGYAPPGNRLAKWHLAGQIEIDERSTWQTIFDAYSSSTGSELIAQKRANLSYPFFEATRGWDFGFWSEAAERRSREFYFLFKSLGPWNVVWLLMPVWWWRAGRRRRMEPKPPKFAIGMPAVGWSLAWVTSTYMIWALLMFGPGTTSLHQGAYTVPLLLATMLMLVAWAMHPVVFVGLAVMQWFHFLTTWLPPGPKVDGAVQPPALLIMLVGVAVLVWRSVSMAREESEKEPRLTNLG